MMNRFGYKARLFLVFLAVCSTSAAPVEQIKTKNYCLGPDLLYRPIGSTFTTKNCSLLCVCDKEGSLGCVDLCPPVGPAVCPQNMKLKVISAPVAAGTGGKKCRCVKRYCEPEQKDVCVGLNNQKYKIGEMFARDDCSEICRCNEDGRLACEPLCPKVSCPKGTVMKEMESTHAIKPRNGCFCRLKPKCVPEKKCLRTDGRILEFGEMYTTRDCRSKCRCRRNGVIRCTSLCNNTTLKCAAGERQVTRTEAVGTRGCTCKKSRCEREKRDISQPRPLSCTTSNGKKLKIGSIYIDEYCTQRCKCTVNGRMKCISLCQNVWEPCGIDEEQVVIREPLPKTNCSCEKRICKKKMQADVPTCFVEGNAFSGNEVYVTRNCTSYCVCGQFATPECSPLCPAIDSPPRCPKGFPEKTNETVPFAPRCFCPKYKCISLDINRTELQENNKPS